MMPLTGVRNSEMVAVRLCGYIGEWGWHFGDYGAWAWAEVVIVCVCRGGAVFRPTVFF